MPAFAADKVKMEMLKAQTSKKPAPASVARPLWYERFSGRTRRLAAAGFLLLTLGLIAYALYAYHFRPLLTMQVPEHQPQPPDTPPQELTSFQVRSGGQLLMPQSMALAGDTLLVSFAGLPLIHAYAPDLKRIKEIELLRPEPIIPVAIAVADTLLIVADSVSKVLVLYDLDGFYLTSSAWYPDSSHRIDPGQIKAGLGMLTLIDANHGQVSVISLIDDPPFYSFLELIRVVSANWVSELASPSAALLAPDSNLWVGDNHRGSITIFAPSGVRLAEAERPQLSTISFPIDMAVVQPNASRATNRVHVLDRDAGKVFVYDLQGNLTLVYPRHRKLDQPSALTVDPMHRHVFIAEQGGSEITVFGY